MASDDRAAVTVHETVERAAEAVDARWNDEGARRAGVLRAIARGLDARRAEIIAVCAEETALYESELVPEFDRMVGTLRMFAGLVESDAWRRPMKCPVVRAASGGEREGAGDADAAPLLIGPNHDVRSILMPLGEVVAVFGASNFPLAYGVCGGDTASALAAGCAVVVKEHPAHPKTGRLIANAARAAITDAGGSPNLLGYVVNEDPKDFTVAKELVQQPCVCAVGFTGSKGGGLALEKLSRERVDIALAPVPVFAEMGSVNPVFITPGAMATRAEVIAEQIADAVFARNGQQCTKPGLVFFADTSGNWEFTKRLHDRFTAGPSRAMLVPWIAEAFERQAEDLEAIRGAGLEGFSRARTEGDDQPRHRVVQALHWSATLDVWLREPQLHEECFGPAVQWVLMDDWSRAETFELGSHLTLSIFFDEADATDVHRAKRLVYRHARSAGRVVFNGVPTGVRVCEAMVHGGPYPATNQPHTTAVGPRAIERWCRPVCFQNAPPELLPAALR